MAYNQIMKFVYPLERLDFSQKEVTKNNPAFRPSVLSEKKLKQKLISGLNKINQGWIDGDIESNSQKTADIVNHSLRIAIEIKDDTKSQPPTIIGSYHSGSYDVKELNKRFFNHIKDANKKFREYTKYKTALLIRTNLPMVVMVREAVGGIRTFKRHKAGQKVVPANAENYIISSGLTYSGRRGKHNRKEIGCFLVLNKCVYSYFTNEFAVRDRKMDKSKIESFFGFTFYDA